MVGVPLISFPKNATKSGKRSVFRTSMAIARFLKPMLRHSVAVKGSAGCQVALGASCPMDEKLIKKWLRVKNQ